MGILSNLSALVTGGTRGIGAAIAKKMSKEGARVAITGTKSPEWDFQVSGIEFLKVDFSKQDQVVAFCGKIRSRPFDILVNNAGVNKIDKFCEIALDDFDWIHQINVRAPLQITQAVLPAMLEKKWGRVVNIGSIFGEISKEYRASYSASKFAMVGMTAALSAEVAKDGVLVNCVSPGFIATELTSRVLGEAGIEAMSKIVPIGRLGQPDEIAEYVTWLSSAKNSLISGQNLIIDGGFVKV